MPCSCNKPKRRVSASRLFVSMKSSEAPEGGWSSRTFRGRRAERMLADWVRVHRAAHMRGFRAMHGMLVDYYDEKINKLIKIATGLSRELTGKAARDSSLTINVGVNASIWEQALNEVFKEDDLELSVRTLPTATSVASETSNRVTILLGEDKKPRNGADITRRSREIAGRVTRVNRTTKNQIRKRVLKATEEGKPVAKAAEELRKDWPNMSRGRISTIARTEMGNAADAGIKSALKFSSTVSHVSVIGCQAVEKNSPTYKGRHTCNIEDVPVEDVDLLVFHPNHTGCIVASRFRDDDEEDETTGDPDEEENERTEDQEELDEAESDEGEDDIYDADGFPRDLAALKLDSRALTSSTGAQLMVDATGKRWVKKTGGEHLEYESAADEVYRALGVEVPKAKLYRSEFGAHVKLAEYEEHAVPLDRWLKTASPGTQKATLEELREGFAVDALLANQDVIGLNLDNVLVRPDGTPIRVDNGSSFKFRAQGDLKDSKSWDDQPLHLWTMRGHGDFAGAARNAATIFGDYRDEQHGLNIYQISRQIDRIDWDKISHLVPEGERARVAARLENMKSIAAKAQDYEADGWKPVYADRVTLGITDIRAKGVMRNASAGLSYNPKLRKGVLEDETGKLFDGLRGDVERRLWEAIDEEVPGGSAFVARWANGQAGDSWSNPSQALKHWIAKNRNDTSSNVYWASSEASAKLMWEDMLTQTKMTEEKASRAITLYHGYVQELLAQMSLPNNDRSMRAVRLMRTEHKAVMDAYGVKPGDNRKLPRGLNESGSLVVEYRLSGTQLTIQAVPHTRVTGVYLTNRPFGTEMFCGDRENEFTFIPTDIPFKYAPGEYGYMDGDAGSDARKWGVPLDHLKKKTAKGA